MTPFPQINKINPQTRYGPMLYNINDQGPGKSIEHYGEYCEDEAHLFRQIVQPGDVVVDAGANIGAHTLVFAQSAGPTGAVFAFEPQRIIFQNLCANLALNSILNTFAYQLALSSAPGSIIIPLIDYTKSGSFGAVGFGQFQNGETVPVITIDSLNLAACKLLKVDVEGMELEVLKGAVKTIERHQPYLYVENDRKEISADLIRFIDSLGYQLFWHRTPLFNPNNFLKCEVNHFPNFGSFNMLCFPKSFNMNLVGFVPVEMPV